MLVSSSLKVIEWILGVNDSLHRKFVIETIFFATSNAFSPLPVASGNQEGGASESYIGDVISAALASKSIPIHCAGRLVRLKLRDPKSTSRTFVSGLLHRVGIVPNSDSG